MFKSHGCNTCGKLCILRKCRRCQQAKYCSHKCQTADWLRHIIDCNTYVGTPVTSAHHLVHATVTGIPLSDPQARLDWGIDKAIALSPDAPPMLHLLYKGLIEEAGVLAMQLHRWRVDGTLVANIKAVYEAMPSEARGERYSWFLAHQSVLTDPYVMEYEDAKGEDSMNRRVWPLVGGDPTACSATIRAFIGKLDDITLNCWALFRWIMSSTYPAPVTPLWLELGFCACPTKEDEMSLAAAYKDLISVCPFYVFCDAYAAGSLASLFLQHNITPYPSPTTASTFRLCLADALSLPPYNTRSVWWLKRLTSIAPDNSEVDWQCPYPLDVEWGFTHGRNKEDMQALMRLYKGFFSCPTSNPLELDAARRAGRLFQFFFVDLGAKVPQGRRMRYKRWLSNIVISSPRIPKEIQDATWERLVDSFCPQKRMVAGVMTRSSTLR